MDKNYYRGEVVEKDLLCNVYKKVFINNNKKAFQNLKGDIKKYEFILTKTEIDYLRNFKLTIINFTVYQRYINLR